MAATKARVLIFVIANILVWAAPLHAQDHWWGKDHWWGLENHSYYDTEMAEIHGAETQVLFPTRTDAFQYSVNPGRRNGWNIDVGHEFPIFGYRRAPSEQVTGANAGSWAFGLWFPLSFHMIEDLGRDPSSPILDTDYRFSGMIKAQYGLKDFGPFTQSHIGLRFQLGHESTHVGDEFTIHATDKFGDQFKRVNVSYEYWEIGLSFEPNWGAFSHQHLKIRGGNIGLLRPGNGWYTPELEHPSGEVIARSQRNIEPYGEVEYYFERDSACESFFQCLGPIVSLDVRDRTIYNYAKLTQSQPEKTEISSNLMVGARQMRRGPGTLGRITPTYYLRYYHGVNPFGQFRNQSNYTLMGLGVHFDF